MRRSFILTAVGIALSLLRCVSDDSPLSSNPTARDSGTQVGNDSSTTSSSSSGGEAGLAPEAQAPLTGTFRWALPMSGLSWIAKTVLRPDGHILAVGTMSESLTFPGGVTLALKGMNDLFVLELDTKGVLQWAENWGAPGLSVSGASLALASNTEVVIAGSWSNGAFLTMPDLGGGEGNPFVLGLTFSNTLRTIKWRRSITTAVGSFGSCNTLSSVEGGRVALGCDIEGNVSLAKVQGGTLTFENVNGPYLAVLVTGNGDAEWHTWMSGGNMMQTLLKPDGTVYAALAGTSITERRSNQVTTAPLNTGRVVLALSSTGQAWGYGFGISSTFGGQGAEIALAPNGDIVAAGAFRGTLSNGQGVTLTSAGTANDLYIARIPASGTAPTSFKQYGSNLFEMFYGFGIAPTGDVVMATGLQATTMFDSLSIAGPANSADGVLSLIKLAPTVKGIWHNSSPVSTWVSASNMSASVTVGADGHVVLSGGVPGILSLPNGNAVNGTIPFNARGFIAAFDP